VDPSRITTKPLLPGMRLLLVLATTLVLLAGVQLFVFAEQTDRWFAWSVDPPITAAFLGAAYWASAAVEWTSSRASTWADARVAVPSVFLFTALTLIVTLIHLDKFHLGAEHALNTRLVTWGWLGVYGLVPIMMAVVWAQQVRLPGLDPPRCRPLPGALRAGLSLLAAALLTLGLWLLVDPEAVASSWPWELTALTGRAVGAWSVGLGVSAVQTVIENDARRARPVAVGAVMLAVLSALALLRYSADIAWGTWSSLVLVAGLCLWAATGILILMLQRHSPADDAVGDA
jgi:hypothetical protein